MRKNILRNCLAVALTLAMVLGMMPMVSTSATAKAQLKITNGRTILVAGHSYKVTNKNAKKVTSSNTKIAKIGKNGAIIPLKTGYATISAKVNGKRISKKLLFTDKNGTTANVTILNKLLTARDLTVVTYKTSTTKSVKEASLSGGTTVKAANTAVQIGRIGNNNTRKTLNIAAPNKDVSIGPNFKTINIMYAGQATVNGMAQQLTVGNANVIMTDKSAVPSITVVGKATINNKSRAATSITLEGTADVTITGSSTPTIFVKDGATVNIDTPANVTVEEGATATINVSADAANAGVKITVKDGSKVEVNVAEGATGTVSVTDSDGKVTTVAGGESTTVDTADSGDDSGTGGTAGGGVITVSKSVTQAQVGNTIVYTCQGGLTWDTISSIDVTLNVFGHTNERVTIPSDVIKYLNNYFTSYHTGLSVSASQEQALLDKWKDTTRTSIVLGDNTNVGILATAGTVANLGKTYTRRVTLGTGIDALSTIDYSTKAFDVAITVDASNSDKIASIRITSVAHTENYISIARDTNTMEIHYAGETYSIVSSADHKVLTVTHGANVFTITINSDTKITVNNTIISSMITINKIQ